MDKQHGHKAMTEKTLSKFELNEMAKALEASGLYRVLRKIETVDAYGEPIEAPDLVRVLVIDTETTGVDCAKDEIIEIGAILIEVSKTTGKLGRVMGHYNGFEQPNVPITPENQAIHGISNEDVEGQCFNEEQIKMIVDHSDLIVAHNAAFDRSFLERRFDFFKDTTWLCSFKDVNWPSLGYAGSKLEYLLGNFGFYHGAHRAIEDCNALAHVLASEVTVNEQAIRVMKLMMENAQKPLISLGALNSPFESKDALKVKGFRWNADLKTWFFEVAGEENLDEIKQWLKENIYKVSPQSNKRVRVSIEKRSGKSRFSSVAVDSEVVEI